MADEDEVSANASSSRFGSVFAFCFRTTSRKAIAGLAILTILMGVSAGGLFVYDRFRQSKIATTNPAVAVVQSKTSDGPATAPGAASATGSDAPVHTLLTRSDAVDDALYICQAPTDVNVRNDVTTDCVARETARLAALTIPIQTKPEVMLDWMKRTQQEEDQCVETATGKTFDELQASQDKRFFDVLWGRCTRLESLQEETRRATKP